MSRKSFDTGSGLPIAWGRTAVAIAILITIALIHMFRVGAHLNGALFVLYYSYFSDIVIPFGIYFSFCMNDTFFRPLRDWRVKAGLVFAIASATEILQAFGVPLLGQTFDPLDFVMFAAGVLLAACVDRFLFDRFLPWWSQWPFGPSDVTR